MDRSASEKHTRFRGIDHFSVDAVLALSCADDYQLVARFLQILIVILIIQVVHRQIDGLKQLALVRGGHLAFDELLLLAEEAEGTGPVAEEVISIVLSHGLDVARTVVAPVDQRREEVESSLHRRNGEVLVLPRCFVHAYFQVCVLEKLQVLGLLKSAHVV